MQYEGDMMAWSCSTASEGGELFGDSGGRGRLTVEPCLIGCSSTEGASASRYTKYDQAVGIDVEILGLVGETVGGESSDIALLYVHVEPMLCEYRCDRCCDAEHQGGRSHYLSVILVGYHVARSRKRLRPV